MGLDISGLLGNMLNAVAKYWWIVAIIGGLIIFIGIAYWLSRVKRKKTQWTHKIRVRRLLQNGKLTPEVIHYARRFPLEKGVEMFELQKPILGSYLMPQPGEYTDVNEFSIILDSYNRIYLNKGYKFNKDKQSIEVSAVHAGIDVEMANMKDKWQQAHKVEKRVTTAELIKAGIKILAIIAVVVVFIVALNKWGETQKYRAESDQAQADAMLHINEAAQTMEKVVNTQQLQIIPMLKALYGENNIEGEINKYRVGNATEIAK